VHTCGQFHVENGRTSGLGLKNSPKPLVLFCFAKHNHWFRQEKPTVIFLPLLSKPSVHFGYVSQKPLVMQ